MGTIVKAEWAIAKQLSKVDCDQTALQTDQLTTQAFTKVFGQQDQSKPLLPPP